MNIVYLHGLMSSNQSPKVDWLKNKNTVFNPYLNYKEDTETLFSDLKTICEENKIDLIIGSSMGGYLGFHLSNKYNIPNLLFNPSLEKNKMVKPKVEEIKNSHVLHTLVLGRNDDVVIPSHTIGFMENGDFNYRVTLEENGHRTPIELLKKHFEWIENSKK